MARYPTDPENGLHAKLTATDEIIIDNVALESSGATTSTAFVLGQTNAGIEIVIEADTVHTVVADIAVSLQTSATSGGTYAEVVGAIIPATTATTVGGFLKALILPLENEDKMYTKLVVTTTGDETALKITAFPRWIP